MDEPTERTSVTLPVSLANRLTFEARRTGTSASALVREALAAFFAEAPDPAMPGFVGIVTGRARPAKDELAAARAAEVTGRRKR